MNTEGMCKLIETLGEMNSNLERIAKVLERAYPPLMITTTKDTTEDVPSMLEKLDSIGYVYKPSIYSWEGDGSIGTEGCVWHLSKVRE